MSLELIEISAMRRIIKSGISEKINLPELDIALAQIAAKDAPSQQDDSPAEAPHEEVDSENSDVASHTEASLAK